MAKAPGSRLDSAELSRLGAEVRSLKTQVEALRARVTDLEKWERQVAEVSVRKHLAKRKVRKHFAPAISGCANTRGQPDGAHVGRSAHHSATFLGRAEAGAASTPPYGSCRPVGRGCFAATWRRFPIPARQCSPACIAASPAW